MLARERNAIKSFWMMLWLQRILGSRAKTSLLDIYDCCPISLMDTNLEAGGKLKPARA